MEAKKKKKFGLTTRIFLGLILGGITGLIVHYLVPESTFRDTILINGVFNVIGTGFMRLMQMLVVPLVFFSIVAGSMAIGDTKKLGRVGLKTIAFYLVTTAIAITIALTVANIINPGFGLDMTSVVAEETTIDHTSAETGVDMLLGIIPKNPVAALAEGNMLQIIMFALLLGLILAHLGNKVPIISRVMNEGNDIMMTMTFIIMKVAPIGVFGLIAKTFSGIGFDGFLPMLKYMGSVIIALILQVGFTYSLILLVFGRTNPLAFLKKFAPVMGFAFSTASSGATVPINISTLDEMGISKKISAFTIPLGATINMDGTAIMQGVAVIFVAQAYGISLSLGDFITVIGTATMASVGTAAVPGVGLITLAMVFNSIGLPVEGIGLIMGIDRILDMARTAVNCTGDAIVTTVVSHQEGLFDRNQFEGKVQDDDDLLNLDDVDL
ncbi:MAG: dicarboxylate/amino acid:cation symporter [Tissierellia bacterium]|nr:dicarboxylate/amino acid:cation symporter [Tissierellia bacterium]